ncbi:MAG: hypothetical protein IJZ54_06950 [Clostridia bacterium]|nr:hypothetical protein [Clostridia bacterium]
MRKSKDNCRKMSPEEAIERIDIILKNSKFTQADRFALNIAKSCIKRLTPEEPRVSSDGYFDGEPVYDIWACPNCGKTYEIDYDEYDHCPDCGQAIDRSILE